MSCHAVYCTLAPMKPMYGMEPSRSAVFPAFGLAPTKLVIANNTYASPYNICIYTPVLHLLSECLQLGLASMQWFWHSTFTGTWVHIHVYWVAPVLRIHSKCLQLALLASIKCLIVHSLYEYVPPHYTSIPRAYVRLLDQDSTKRWLIVDSPHYI